MSRRRLVPSLVLAALVLACGREVAVMSKDGPVERERMQDSAPVDLQQLRVESSAAAAPPSERLANAVGVAADQRRDGGGTGGFRFQSLGSQIASMVIRTGHASIEVDSLEIAIGRVSAIAAAAGGYLANTAIQTGENSPRNATMEIKVPSDRYQGAVDRLSEIGKVINASTTSQDVGEEYVDVTARVDNAKKLEARLIDLLANRTGKLSDVLTVERELARVREEIERYEGRLRWLRTQVSMSTLTINAYEPVPLVGDPGENVLVEAFKRSWRNFVEVIAAGIAAAGGVIPVVAFGLLVLVGVRAVWRRIKPQGPAAAGA